MNTTEHLLTVLSEECGEVSKEISKTLRFGLDDKVTRDPNGPRGTEGPTNREKIAAEMVDLFATYRLCVGAGILPDLGFCTEDEAVIAAANAKQKRVHDYMSYARRVGSLTDH